MSFKQRQEKQSDLEQEKKDQSFDEPSESDESQQHHENPKADSEHHNENNKSKVGRPKKSGNQTAVPMKKYFSNNTAGMILLNCNYIHKATQLLKQEKGGKRMQGTTTFCFYQNFYTDCNYDQLPERVQGLEENMKDLIKAQMVTMPQQVFDQFLDLILRVIDNLKKNKSQDLAIQEASKIIQKCPLLTFRNAQKLKKHGYFLPDTEQTKMDSYVKEWLKKLTNLIYAEMNNEESSVFESEYSSSQKTKTTIPWQSKKSTGNPGKRQRTKKTSIQDDDQESQQKGARKKRNT